MEKPRFDPKMLDDLARRLANALPDSVRTLKGDVEKNLRASLDSILRDMHLVTRDEFEVQKAVLERTRAKLEALEREVQQLETQQAAPPE